jgi:hypothetical protein
MNNSKNWVILIIVLVVLGLGYWYFTQGMSAPGTTGTATTTPNGTGTTNNAGGTQAGGSAQGGAGTGTGSTGGKTYTAQIAITGFTAQTSTDFPLVNYSVDTALTGQGFFSLIGQNTNTVVWGKNQAIKGTYTLDPNQITVQENSPSHKLLSGDYFIRITDSSGAIVGESRPFRLAPGQVTNN